MTTGSPRDSEETVFTTVCTTDFFLGLVGLLNSLRLLGHDERVVVLDCGLSSEQRAILRGHCELVKPELGEAANATAYKAFGSLLSPRGVAVVIDSDMIVARRLDPILQAARDGKVCAFVDPDRDRWFAEWQSIFELERPPRREPYVTASLVAFSNERWPDLLARWSASCARVAMRPTIAEGAPTSDPVSQCDQDALNALLKSEFPEEAVQHLPDTGIVQSSFQRATVLDQRTLECRFNGETPFVLHWPGRPKPWNWQGRNAWQGWLKFADDNPYVVLLRRLLTWDDVAIRVPEGALPGRLRPGIAGVLAFRALGAVGRTASSDALSTARRFARAQLRRRLNRPP